MCVYMYHQLGTFNQYQNRQQQNLRSHQIKSHQSMSPSALFCFGYTTCTALSLFFWISIKNDGNENAVKKESEK